MRVSWRWLNQYIELTPDIEELARVLTFSGIEVEAVIRYEALPDSVITAKVVSARPIPGSDHLVVCKVDYGAFEPVQVVCGAPNCHEGMISVLALPGTKLQDLEIQSAKLRGVESAGMLCSERELGVSDNHAGIIELDPETPIGISVNELYCLPDTVFELEITPNRPDLLGYLGIARDLSASTGKPVRFPEHKVFVGESGHSMGLNLVLQEPELCPRYTARLLEGLSVKESPQWLKTALIKSGLRPINNIVDVTNYVMLETGHPLHAFDYHQLRPVKDSDPIPAIVVRRAKDQEKFLALDGKEYELDGDDLVIADGQIPSALAGVIGGKEAGIGQATTAIVLEAAAFAPGSIRKTSYNHKITTDSAFRFERHLSPAMPDGVSHRAVELLLETAGGRVVNQLYDAYPKPLAQQYLALRPCRFEQLIGFELSSEQIIAFLEPLGVRFIQYGNWIEGSISDPGQINCFHGDEIKAGVTEFVHKDDCVHALYFSIPSFRVDLTREIDLIEELARLAGYDKAPQKRGVSLIMDRHAHSLRRKIADHFVRHSCYEVLNYSFSDPAQLALLAFKPEMIKERSIGLINPQSSNQSAMRISLLPQLLGNLAYNLNHGERDLKLMELAKLYLKDGDRYLEPYHLTAVLTGKAGSEHWKNKAEQLNLYHIKGMVESLLIGLKHINYTLGTCDKPYLVQTDALTFDCTGQPIATLGRLQSSMAEAFGIDTTVLKQEIWVIEIEVSQLIELTRDQQVEYVPLSKYPSVSRDLSFVIELNVPYSEIRQRIQDVDPHLISAVEIFDEYRGKQIPDGCRSISLHIVLQDSEKTLTDERVDACIASVIEMLTSTWSISMR